MTEEMTQLAVPGILALMILKEVFAFVKNKTNGRTGDPADMNEKKLHRKTSGETRDIAVLIDKKLDGIVGGLGEMALHSDYERKQSDRHLDLLENIYKEQIRGNQL